MKAVPPALTELSKTAALHPKLPIPLAILILDRSQNARVANARRKASWQPHPPTNPFPVSSEVQIQADMHSQHMP